MRGARALVGAYAVFVALCAPAVLFASEVEDPSASGGAVIAPPSGEPDGASASTSAGPKQTGHDVAMRDYKFVPKEITVDVGDTVTFTNEDTAEHNAIAEDDSFRTSTFGEGESESVTISEAGSYPYFCSLHANMEGRISTTGSEPSGGGGSGGSGGGGGSASAGGGSGAGDIPLIPGDPGATGSTAPGTGATSGGSGGGGTLPLTGSDSTWLAIAGLWLLSVGVAVRAAVAGRI
jgi:LPXTG-motif cell wall-anchored protein